MDTFPADAKVKTVSSSKGSDGHSMAVTTDGQVYSWGDGMLQYLVSGVGVNTAESAIMACSYIVDAHYYVRVQYSILYYIRTVELFISS